VVTYLFLGSTGAGVLLILIALDFATSKASQPSVASVIETANTRKSYLPQKLYGSFFAPGFQLASLVLVLGAVCLTSDLGHPDRMLNLFLHPTLSYVSFGTYALSISIVCALAMAAIWTLPILRLPTLAVRGIECLGILAASVLIVYTGMLLYSMGTGSLLGSLLIPALFVFSALSCGIALLLFIAGLNGTLQYFSSTYRLLAKLDSALICLELVTLVVFLALAIINTNVVDHALVLLQGAQAPVFYLLLIGCGLLLPLALENIPHLHLDKVAVPVALAVLIGGFTLRWILVQVGFPIFGQGMI
jgi:formate-dependent nitrite reductase membrane component NrfD